MIHKVNPHNLRVGIIINWESKWVLQPQITAKFISVMEAQYTKTKRKGDVYEINSRIR